MTFAKCNTFLNCANAFPIKPKQVDHVKNEMWTTTLDKFH